MKLDKKYTKIIFLLFLLIVIFFSWTAVTLPYHKNVSSLNETICPLKYSPVKELDNGENIIALYNGKNITIKNIELEISKDGKIYKYKVPGTLGIDDSTYKVFSRNISSENINLKWCCDSKCYKMEYNTGESEDIEIKSMGLEEENIKNTSNRTSLEGKNTNKSVRSYPPHPKPEDCEDINNYMEGFCYADIAEIRGEMKYCDKIEDFEINAFCRARVKLNKSICEKIEDEGLRNECIWSINTKKEWLGEG